MASINNNGNDSNRGNINEHQTHLSDNSNRVIAPERSQRTRDFDDVLRRGGNWESHPRGEYVLLCREHLDRIEHIVENWEHISENLPTDSPSDKLQEKVNAAYQQSLKLYQSIRDIIVLYNNPDYPCPEDYERFNQEREAYDALYPLVRRRGQWVPSSHQVSPAKVTIAKQHQVRRA
jgi:hypothetical protein